MVPSPGTTSMMRGRCRLLLQLAASRTMYVAGGTAVVLQSGRLLLTKSFVELYCILHRVDAASVGCKEDEVPVPKVTFVSRGR